MGRFFKLSLVTVLAALLAAGLAATSAEARDHGQPAIERYAGQLTATGSVPLLTRTAPDRDALALEDAERAAAGLPYRFAVPSAVRLTPDDAGAWETTDDGLAVWRLRITSPQAVSLNLGFTRFQMPEGGTLWLYSEDLAQRIRPFTAEDNAPHGELWTPVLRGETLVAELSVPLASRDDVVLELTQVGIGYRGFFKDHLAESGSCNVDVVCPDGDGWRDEIPSVNVLQINGSLNCTGFMVNNTAQDETPYLMTARHCGVNSSNAASTVAYWNYETSTCGGTPDGTLDEFNSGSFWRASYSPSDFTLVELDSDPDPSFGVTFAGWDRSGSDASSATAIHHPSVDEKRISFENQPTTTTSYLGTSQPGDGTHVRVADWDTGTTEGGSSGSPLFDQNHHVIGQLHGGYAACSNNSADWYGKFSVSWSGGGTSTTRLSNWLDPLGTGQMTLDTLVPGAGCTTSAECDDGQFCNGAETCVANACQAGTDPCPGQACDEAADQCTTGTCDNDSVCEAGEDCNSCSGDCISGTTNPGCGNGVCEPSIGEDCLSCSSDCAGKQKGKTSNQYCCGDGAGTNPVGCADARCTTDTLSCSNGGFSESYCCGDGTCGGDETSSNCEVDCGPPPQCGAVGESCASDGDCCSGKCKGPSGGQTCR